MRAYEFEGLVREALQELPPEFLERLENVDVLVQRWPSHQQLAVEELEEGETLFGLYEGIPLTDRDDYNMALPDRITIFQGPIEEQCNTREEMAQEVRQTVVHEVAHHFGISDLELDEWGVS
jgi:predicted Zn-dependent protease with MMP-like domain